MATFFPGFPSDDFTPLFRLLDDYDVHRSRGPGRNGTGKTGIRAFQPKFDVKELKDSYELHGELAGVDQKDVSIEFTDPQTLVIKGRVEREYTSGTPPTNVAIEGSSSQGKITEDDSHKYHKATVEDEGAEKANGANGAESSEVAKSEQQQQQQKPQQKYWVSERSIGEFQRSFAFPSRVDQDAVKASLKNGILSIVVPKAQAPQSRRINIE